MLWWHSINICTVYKYINYFCSIFSRLAYCLVPYNHICIIVLYFHLNCLDDFWVIHPWWFIWTLPKFYIKNLSHLWPVEFFSCDKVSPFVNQTPAPCRNKWKNMFSVLILVYHNKQCIKNCFSSFLKKIYQVVFDG